MAVESNPERGVDRAMLGDRGQQLAPYLPWLRDALERERDFRIRQLAELEATAPSGDAPADPSDSSLGAALRNVTSLVVVGARRALADTERALAAMDAGRYGYCAACGGEIPLAMLLAVPRSRRCLQCHRPPDDSAMSITS